MSFFLAGSRAGRQAGQRQREEGYSAKVHSSRLCHSDTPPAHGATPDGNVHPETLHEFSRIQSIDSWPSGCYFR
jgi:hypothetical protein